MIQESTRDRPISSALSITLEAALLIIDEHPDRPLQDAVAHPNQTADLVISLEEFWAIHQCIKAAGDGILYLFGRGAWVANGGDIAPDQNHRLIHFVRVLLNTESQLIPNDEFLVLRMSYSLLHEDRISRKQAADLANEFLHTTYSSEAWRKRVNKWAGTVGKPALDLPKGRKPVKP